MTYILLLLPSSIHPLTSPIHCFLIHTSFPPLEHVYPFTSHPPLLLWVWCLANGQAERSVGTLYAPRPVGTTPVKHASLLWHFNYISPTCSPGWTRTKGRRCKLWVSYKSYDSESKGVREKFHQHAMSEKKYIHKHFSPRGVLSPKLRNKYH